MQIKVQIMEGQEYKHLLDYMSEKRTFLNITRNNYKKC
jgi:hypothetical protein